MGVSEEDVAVSAEGAAVAVSAGCDGRAGTAGVVMVDVGLGECYGVTADGAAFVLGFPECVASCGEFLAVSGSPFPRVFARVAGLTRLVVFEVAKVGTVGSAGLECAFPAHRRGCGGAA